MARTAGYTNNTSRQRKYVCACTWHVVDVALNVATNGAKGIRPGPYVIRAAGDGLTVTCDACGSMFQLEDVAATRTRVYAGCAHCEDPEAHATNRAGCANAALVAFRTPIYSNSMAMVTGSRLVTCKFCDTAGLVWRRDETTDYKWKLTDLRNVPHMCDRTNGPEECWSCREVILCPADHADDCEASLLDD
jgi:hypothetical protein